MEFLIKIVELEKVFKDNFKALKGVSLEINKGDFVAIIGPSGSGKSTLLNIIGCLDKKTSGEYYLNGKEISECNNNEMAALRNKEFGFVVQSFALLKDYTIYDNIKIPLEYAKVKRSEIKKRVIEVSEKLKIEDQLKKKPSKLSGGQCQRAAIGRALVNNPNIILADEPTGALDKQTSEEVINIFKSLNKEGKTIIMVTHNLEMAEVATKIFKIDDGMIEIIKK
ncbi:MAG: ABC transporter ATP-binding protein [Clostridium sp.]|uniref:ABC transporter ATP-binding protein n=1 Tax=Clostridium sp. TaxID=1506 RepID=UPI003F336109